MSELPTAASRTAVVVLAAGAGTRLGAGRNKVLLPLRGRPLLAWSLEAAAALRPHPLLVVVVAEADRAEVSGYLDPDVSLVVGGQTRHHSEWRALQHLARRIDAGEIDLVAIHDAARPLAPTSLFEAVLARAAEVGAAIPGRLQHDLLALDGSPGPAEVLAVQTPQAFRAAPLLEAFRRADRDGVSGTDTASTLERYGDLSVGFVESPATNLKVTFAEDLAIADRLTAETSQVNDPEASRRRR